MVRSIRSAEKKTIYTYLAAFVLMVCVAVAAFVVTDKEPGGIGDSGERDVKIDSRGFLMADVSEPSMIVAFAKDRDEQATEAVPIGIGPIPQVPTLTDEELELYGVLSNSDGFVSSKDASLLNENVHWREVILEEDDTLADIAERYGISVDDIRRANDLKKGESPNYSNILCVPDAPEYVADTLFFVRKLKKMELCLGKQSKELKLTAYVVRRGDSLWSIANDFNLDFDTIVGSNKLKNIDMLQPGQTLRIPNQDGIFVKVVGNDTVDKLVRRYGTTKEGIFVANSMSESDRLIAGREIFLPGAKVAAVIESGSKRRVKAVGVNKNDAVKFHWPIAGKITSNFGWRRNPFGRGRSFHAGLDLGAPRGRDVVAACSGRVVYSGWMGGYGRAVVIRHDSIYSTLYGHCSSLMVTKGAYVETGQLIARVGSTGRATGNHLHFEIRLNGKPVNPLKFLR